MKKNRKIKAKFLFKMGICLALLFVVFLSMDTSHVSLATEEKEFCYLSDIQYRSDSTVGWGSITLDRNLEPSVNNGLITLIVDGENKQFFKGISAHATSTLIYDITSYNYDYFTAYIGVDQSRGNNGNGVKFAIYTSADGENWDLKTPVSPRVMKGNTEAEFVKIDIRDANYLKLYAHNNGNDTADHAVYADAKLIKEGYEESEGAKVDFIKTVAEYDQIIKSHQGEEITGEYELALLQREFVSKADYDYLQFMANYKDSYKETLEWLMTDVENMRYYVLGGTPTGGYANSLKELVRLFQEYRSDFDITNPISDEGIRRLHNRRPDAPITKGDLYKRMAITLSLTHSAKVCLWMQPAAPENQSDSVVRYQIYKDMYNQGKFKATDSVNITPWFESYNIEEMRYVMNTALDDESTVWLNEYTQSKIDAAPNSAWGLLTPHSYISYVWPNYQNPVYYAEENYDYFNELFSVNGKTLEDYGITRGTSDHMVYKLWMNFRNKFGTGCVCGGISKSGHCIRGSHAIPSAVIGQPGHAALLYYTQDSNGKGYWGIDNDVSGWTLSEKGERLPLGWGNASYSRGYSVVYIALAQEAMNDQENLEKCQKIIMEAKVYEGDSIKQEEIYRKALEVQPINIDAWYGLYNAYLANPAKTEDDYYELAKEMGEALKYFPLPMYHLTNLIKPKLTSIENSYRFTLLQTRILNEGKNTPNNTADSYTVYQPSLTRLEANYILGNLDTSIATFSFDGEDANKIVLSSRFDGNGVRWDYCIDGHPLDGLSHWHEVAFDGSEEHKLLLTPEEIASITAENDIYIHIVGVNYSEENLYKIDIQESKGLPATLYANDLENKLMAAVPEMQWKYREEDNWKFYREEEPDLTGDKTVIVRMGATGVYLTSKTTSTFTFTQDNLPETRQYIPISHLSIENVSTEATNQQGAATFAIDGNANTRYHSAWNGSDTERYMTIKLDRPLYLSAVEFIPAGGGNGKIYDGTIYGSMDGENWEILSQQKNLTYTNATNTVEQAIDNTKAFEIDNPAKVQYVKIVADRTNGNWFAARMFNFFEDTTMQVAGKFSFDGENAGKIILEAGLEEEAWKYSLDAGNTWKPASGIEHQLTAEEISQINENNEIKIKLDSDGSKGTIHIKKGDTPTITPYVNDWENRLIGINDVSSLEWKLENENTWKSYADEEPVVLGNKKLLVRTKATGIYTASESLEYQFTEDNQPDTEKYIPIRHLSIHEYSTQSIDSGRPYYAPNVIDGNINTIWHTDFRYSIQGSRAYITIKLDEAKSISALEFAQKKYRSDDPSYIKNAIVYVGKNGNDWIEAGRMQNCQQTEECQKIRFDESVAGQYVKLEMEGYGIFASASMINLYEDTTVKVVGSFSFDGEDAGKIILADEFSGSNWEYSLDSGNTWKTGNGDAHLLTATEIEQINENDKIKIRLNGEEHIINIRKMETPTITAYLNDLENRLIGMGDVTGLEWKIEGDTNWTSYSEKEPMVLGNKKLFVRAKARNILTASESLEYQFTEDNQEDTRKYVPISQLSLASVSAEDIRQNGAAANALDGNYNTRWLNSSAGTDTGKYIVIKFDSAIYLSAMDYVPHLENGKILTGKILGSMDGENFTEIKTVTGWANNQLTKTVDFDEAVKVRYVKIIGVETSYTSAKRHVGARMFNFYEDITKKEVVIPTAQIEYDIKTLTNQDVVARLVNPSTEITVLNNNGSTMHTFTENGEFTFEFEDSEGNKGTATARVDWICKTLPNATFTYDITNPTNRDVTVTVIFDRPGTVVTNNNGNNTHTFTENGEFTFNFRGPYGNEGTATAKVDWICKTLPNATFTYDITETTNQNVTVTVTFDRPGTVVTNNNGENTYTFTQNGEFTFEFVGPYGNAGVATARVNWIDKTIPAANITYDITELTNRNVTATLNSAEEITITNNEGNEAHTFTENGEFTFEFINQLGNKGTATAKVDWIDKKVPNATISYNITEATNQEVIATVSFDEENVRITNNDGNDTYSFTENDEFVFEFMDQAGNEGTARAEVTWIDKTLPVATITYSTTNPTNGDVVATIDFDKENVTVEGGNTYTFTENGEYEFRFVGPAGNRGVAKAKVTWIDKEIPQPIMVYSTINPTNQEVTARITFENKENVAITNNGGKDTYTFVENGEFTFEFMDEAGNRGAVKAIVNWIDKIAPRATVSYNITESTNGSVIATLENASEEITITNNDGKNTYTFTRNGEFTFEFVDQAGNRGTAKATVNWIDRTLPITTITYSTTSLTNQDVVATISFDKENVTVEGGNTHTFTENGEYTFEFTDEAGNIGMKTAIVNWIDKVAPTARIEYSTLDATTENVIATLVNASEEINITNNDGKNTYTFTQNDEFIFEFEDRAGNKGTATATVTWIKEDPDVPNPPDKPEEITSNVYKIEEGFISRIAPETTVSQFKENVETEQEMVFMDKNGTVLGENDIIATEMTVKVGSTLQFTLIVTGDLDGNGKLTITDFAKMKLHLIEEKLLTGNELKAADVNGNGQVTITDFAQMKLILIDSMEIM